MESEKILLQNLERHAQEYANQVLASKEELKKLEVEKENVKIETARILEKTKSDIQIEKDNFSRIVSQENTRLEKEIKELEEKRESFKKLHIQTEQLNQESKAREQQSIEALNKAQKELEAYRKLCKEYEILISEVTRKEVELDNKLKSIQPELDYIKKTKESNNKMEQELVKTSQKITAKQAELDQKEAFLLEKENTIKSRELTCINWEEKLAKREEELKIKEKENTEIRSDLEKGQRNLLELQKEMDDLIKIKEMKK